MSEESSDELEAEAEEPELKTFIVCCETTDAMEEDLPEPARIGAQEFLDKIDAVNEEQAKNIVTGFLAERDFIVTKWNFVSEASYLSELARAVNP